MLMQVSTIIFLKKLMFVRVFDNSFSFLMCYLDILPIPITRKLSIDISANPVALFLLYELC